MDPSDIARLLEMFEERFGKKASSAVMTLVVFAVVVWAIHLISEYFILPVYAIAQSAAKIGIINEVSRWLDAVTNLDVLFGISWIVLCYVVFLVIIHVIKKRAQRKFNEEQLKIEAIIDNCSIIAQETELFCEKQVSEARNIIKEARETVEYANEKLQKIKEIEGFLLPRGKK